MYRRHRRARWRAAAVICAFFIGASVGHANEGFWPFNRIPKAAIKQALGVELTDEWIRTVQQASVRFPGGSGAFVSPDGLLLTNHHVSLEAIQRLSTAERDLVTRGFVARDRSQELRAPDLEVESLQAIEDVTGRVNAPVTAAMTPADSLAARRVVIAAIEKEANQLPGFEGEVVTLYQGAQYHLYRYRKHTDVRLVFAPEFDSAFFGGDPDNFTFPRYCLDMALWRVYEEGRPLATRSFLRWSTTGAKAGEAVFTSGHPAQTQRLNTVAHLEFLRDHSLPLSIGAYTLVRDALDSYSRRGAEQARQVHDDFFGIENGLKSWKGQLAGLRDPVLLNQKRQMEQRLRTRIEAAPDLKSKYGNAWDQIAGARQALPAYNAERVLFENGLGLYSPYFMTARMLVRWAGESRKPNGERLPEFTDARAQQLERQVGAAAPIYPGVEQAKLSATLAFMQQQLGPDHPVVRQVLAGRSAASRAEELVRTTTLGDASARKALLAGGQAAVDASTDPFIALARLLEPRSRELRKRFDGEVLAVERDAYAKIAQAVFAVEGEAAYPDGTFTLRLSYGAVKGYAENGKAVAPFTEIGGLFSRAEARGLKPPYRYADSWARARSTLNMAAPFNLVSTNDIVGGNSGSPLINSRGELVGLIFDGNLQSLPGYFVYDDAANRAVSVDVRGMTEALRTVYKAEALVSELTAATAGTR
jgi:hypothetical protein